MSVYMCKEKRMEEYTPNFQIKLPTGSETGEGNDFYYSLYTLHFCNFQYLQQTVLLL